MKNKQKEDISLILTISIPILLGIGTACFLFSNEYLIENLSDVMKEAVTLLVTLFGFILASLSILISFEGNEKTKQLRESRHYKKILGVHLMSDIWMFFGTGCLFGFNIFGLLNKTVAWVFVLIVSVSFYYLAIVLFYLAIMIGTLFVKKTNYH